VRRLGEGEHATIEPGQPVAPGYLGLVRRSVVVGDGARALVVGKGTDRLGLGEVHDERLVGLDGGVAVHHHGDVVGPATLAAQAHAAGGRLVVGRGGGRAVGRGPVDGGDGGRARLGDGE